MKVLDFVTFRHVDVNIFSIQQRWVVSYCVWNVFEEVDGWRVDLDNENNEQTVIKAVDFPETACLFGYKSKESTPSFYKSSGLRASGLCGIVFFSNIFGVMIYSMPY